MHLSFTPDGVLFDCDSTLTTIEGIDQLAAYNEMEEAIAAMTNAAMEGRLPLEDVYAERLRLVKPTREQVARVAEAYWQHQTPGVVDLIATLQRRGVAVGVVSGGLRDAVAPFAERCGVAGEDVFAVDLEYDAAGRFVDVVGSPLTTSSGKREVAAAWKATRHLKGVVLIGDGMSDVAALGGADAVVGYGGVVRRESVAREATTYCEQLEEILSLWESRD